MVSSYLLHISHTCITETNFTAFPLLPRPALPSPLLVVKQIKSLERQGYTVLYARDDWSESSLYEDTSRASVMDTFGSGHPYDLYAHDCVRLISWE